MEAEVDVGQEDPDRLEREDIGEITPIAVSIARKASIAISDREGGGSGYSSWTIFYK